VKNRAWIILVVIILASCLNFNATITLATKKELDRQIFRNNALISENFTQSLQEIGQYRERYGYPIDIKIQGGVCLFVQQEKGVLSVLSFPAGDNFHCKLEQTCACWEV